MSDKSSKAREEGLLVQTSLNQAIKDKIFNKIYFYILVSFRW